MTEIQLVNIKEENYKSHLIYKPTTMNKSNYQIIFKSKKPQHFQFILYAKFADFIELINYDKIDNFNIFPYNGILYSCLIDEKSPLVIKINPLDLCTKIIIRKKLFNPVKSLNLNHIKWDNIFIINLSRRPDRKIQMEKKFSMANITQYQFIEACDGSDSKIITQYNKLKKEKNLHIITPGHFACLLSHIKAIKLAKQMNYKQIMILEDDVFFQNNLLDILHNIYVPDYDMLYLGGIMSKKKYFNENWAYSNKTNIIGAYAYILSSNIYDIILKELEKLEEYVDFFYLKQIQPNYKTIILNDIIKTDLTSSDTSNKSRKMIKRLNYLQ